MNYTDLPLHPKIQKAIAELGFETPTDIQAQAIPKILEGFDIRGCAKTGTGKTAAFLLPALQRLAEFKENKRGTPKVLILVPTRELGLQISSQWTLLAKYLTNLHQVNICGGVPFPIQKQQLSKPHSFIIATPGRLLDLIQRKMITLNEVDMLVLDEADRMLDLGFSEPVQEIVSHLPKERQTLLFSATLHKRIHALSKMLMGPSPLDITVEEEKSLMQENIKQTVHYTDSLKHKNELLELMLQTKQHDQVIIFTSTKRHADQLSSELRDKGYRCAALHGDMYQKKRTQTLARLRKKEIEILVATDVAARGIDVKTITHVINFDLPYNVEDYVHRIGRTGRAGATGTALSFAAKRDAGLVRRIEKYTGQTFEVTGEPGKEIDSDNPAKRRPFKQRRPVRGGFNKRDRY